MSRELVEIPTSEIFERLKFRARWKFFVGAFLDKSGSMDSFLSGEVTTFVQFTKSLVLIGALDFEYVYSKFQVVSKCKIM